MQAQVVAWTERVLVGMQGVGRWEGGLSAEAMEVDSGMRIVVEFQVVVVRVEVARVAVGRVGWEEMDWFVLEMARAVDRAMEMEVVARAARVKGDVRMAMVWEWKGVKVVEVDGVLVIAAVEQEAEEKMVEAMEKVTQGEAMRMDGGLLETPKKGLASKVVAQEEEALVWVVRVDLARAAIEMEVAIWEEVEWVE
ncbi:MAG: hypothetical protein SGPRY_001980 [Prymnesium sp.]